MTLNYSLLGALFFSVPALAAFLMLVRYFSRRNTRLGLDRPTPETEPNRQLKIIATFVFVLTIRLLTISIVDRHWDNFRHLFEIPPRSTDGLLLIGLAHIGLFAIILTAVIGLIEIYDWVNIKNPNRTA